MRNFIKLPDIRNVAAGATAILNVPVGQTYHSITLSYYEAGSLAAVADTKAAITNIKCKINGKTQWELTSTELYELNALRGIAANDGQLNLFFSEPWRKTVQAEDSTAWGTADVDTFQIEITIDAAATTPTMEARADVENIRRPMGTIRKIRKVNQPSGVANGYVNVHDLPRNPNDAYSAVHGKHANLTGGRVRIENEDWFDSDVETLDNHYETFGLVPQTNYVSFIFDKTNRLGDLLKMMRERADGTLTRVSDMRFDFLIGTAAEFPVITEVYGPRD